MEQLDRLKNKYESAFRKMDELGVRLQNVHIQDNKLFVRGAAPSADAKNAVWDIIKIIDPSYKDLTVDLSVDPNLAPPKAATAPAAKAARTHTVQSGDTLSKIAKSAYGDANKYMKIFEANKDKLQNPDMIKPGQVLTIPD
jgi:nucleoid-associated protein YgaU